jgi:hypothetical protein
LAFLRRMRSLPTWHNNGPPEHAHTLWHCEACEGKEGEWGRRGTQRVDDEDKFRVRDGTRTLGQSSRGVTISGQEAYRPPQSVA